MTLIIRLMKIGTLLLDCQALENCLLSRTSTKAPAYVSLACEEQRAVRESSMRSTVDTELDDELRAEYDLSQLQGGVRVKYV